VRPFQILAVFLLFIAGTIAAGTAKHPSVTLDVKDEDVRVVLKSIQKQCGIRNLIIDPGVTGSGTFLFHDVPCKVALNTVMRVNGLAMKTWSSSVVTVRPR
jgi:type II secretory pathway component HofQ